MAWFDPNYAFKKQITLLHSQVSGGSDLTNFPVLISLTDANLKTTGNGGSVRSSSGYDIIFVNSAENTKLDHEIESYTASTGAIVMWVRIPTLSASSNTIIYMYYGNSLVTSSQTNPNGVWNSNYQAVYHLNQATGATVIDSTSHATNLTPSTSNPTSSNGQIGSDLVFTSANSQYLASSTVPTGQQFQSTSAITLSFWVKQTSGNTGCVLSTLNDSLVGWELGEGGTSGQLFFILSSSFPSNCIDIQTTSATVITDGSWHYVVLFYSGSGQASGMSIYLDGSQTGTALTTNIDSLSNSISYTSNKLYIGSRASIAKYFDGQLDEIHISSSQRALGWVTTEYNNQSSPSSFFTVGSPITGPGPSSNVIYVVDL